MIKFVGIWYIVAICMVYHSLEDCGRFFFLLNRLQEKEEAEKYAERI